MEESSFALVVADAAQLHVRRWSPDGGGASRALILIHGMAEHAARYGRLAEGLTEAGYAVYAPDLRGHGKSAPDESDLGFFATEGGWDLLVSDVAALRAKVAQEVPVLPLVLMGHSMGSYLARSYFQLHGAGLAACILSGTNGGGAALVKAGRLLAKAERFRLGPRGRSGLLQKATLGDYNRRFTPTRTDNDWLSRDTDEVDKYIADPLCGFDFTVGGWIDIMDGLVRNDTEDMLQGVPSDVPCYLFSGDSDPAGRFGKGPRWVADAFAARGVKDVSLKLYAGGRHEMLNETNRDEVTADLVRWLAERLP